MTKRDSSAMHLFLMNIDDLGRPMYTKDRLKKNASTELGLSYYFNKQGSVN